MTMAALSIGVRRGVEACGDGVGAAGAVAGGDVLTDVDAGADDAGAPSVRPKLP